MAKSKAKKKRDHHLRNTGQNVTMRRGIDPDFCMMVRTTKTKKEALAKKETKHKKRSLQEKDIPLSKDRFLFLCLP
ncbi:hypothetical protein LCL96_08940 [Rossellomorea aquimaris]|uniref:hypothetical protein n=1 Tax=Rossellomorea aquimaris TaxID=189382 RepID=UPI001CD7C4AC|nr:hypothetical protein [Rossellomorea aquimaris]MCA1059060.1 hypothetical protein [Rossellomorea aquimaris]